MTIRIIALLLLPLALLSSRAYSADLGMVRMGIVQGDVQIYSEDAGDWVPAAANTPLGQGNRIWVPAGGRRQQQPQKPVQTIKQQQPVARQPIVNQPSAPPGQQPRLQLLSHVSRAETTTSDLRS